MEFRIQTGEPVFATEGYNGRQVTDWGINIVMAPQVWNQTKGDGVTVAVLDTGVDINHPDLAPNCLGGVNFTTSNPNDYMDRQGHGTHVAGIICGCDNEIGVVGVAPRTKFYAVKVLGDDGSGSLDWITKGVDWAIEKKVDIISMSLGTNQEPPFYFHQVFKKAHAAGILVIVASGNEYQKTIGWPAFYPENIAVGAVASTLDRADFSNHGFGLDITAPGVDIFSTYPVSHYARLSGTSMATPVVTGCLALLISKAKAQGKKFTVTEIHQKIKDSSVDLGKDGFDGEYGAGLINLSRLLKF